MNTKLNNNRPITQENCDMSPVVSEIRWLFYIKYKLNKYIIFYKMTEDID